jgi:hypothetical protein
MVVVETDHHVASPANSSILPQQSASFIKLQRSCAFSSRTHVAMVAIIIASGPS